MSEIMLKVSHVSKQYKLGQIGGTTLREEIQRWTAKRKHQEDPTKKIGTPDYEFGELFMALDDVSFQVEKGERVGIIGHNGAGKSTLLKLISRITAPTSGDIWMNGRVASMLEVGTGFHGELTGRENIYMNGAILGMKKKEIDAKIEDIIEFSECRQFIDTPVKRYSSGMYVKLAFSVAAHLDAEIMIMDEVLAVGDMKFQEKCLGKMSDVSESDGRTILYVSHNMNTIRQLCSRCIVLDHGSIIFNGEVEKAISMYLSAIPVSECNIDLSKLKRSDQFLDKTVTMTQLHVQTENSLFYTGSAFTASLYIHSKKSINNVRLEIPVRSTGGISVTRYLSSASIKLEKDSITKIDFILDISRISPGRYTLNPVLREVNSYGTTKNLDGLVGAYCFEIIPGTGFNDGTEWNSYYSGYYVAPQIKIL